MAQSILYSHSHRISSLSICIANERHRLLFISLRYELCVNIFFKIKVNTLNLQFISFFFSLFLLFFFLKKSLNSLYSIYFYFIELRINLWVWEMKVNTYFAVSSVHNWCTVEILAVITSIRFNFLAFFSAIVLLKYNGLIMMRLDRVFHGLICSIRKLTS